MRIILMRMMACLALLVALTGCGASADDDTGKVRVTTGFYPLAYVAERVGGDLVEVENLTLPGGEPHDLELTVQQTVAIAEADVVVYERGFQPAVDAGVEQGSQGATLDAADIVDLQPAADRPDEADPHFWHDPLRLAELADALATELGRADPGQRATYRANAEDLAADLTALDRDFTAGLARCERDTIVTAHDAFGYLTKYGLEVEPITGLSPDAEPTPADLARLQDLIREQGITTVFSERLVSPKLADTLAGDLGIRSAVLDPIEGLSDASADEDYVSLMRANLTALEQANGCR
jgi:zinc transport system substrate-binding protein